MGLMSNDLARLSPEAQKQVMEKMRKPGKYKAQKTKRGKLTFDSKKEAERYDALMLLQKAGEIRGLKLQVRYCLQEAYTTFEGDRVKSIDYIADFVYERRTAPDSYGRRYWMLSAICKAYRNGGRFRCYEVVCIKEDDGDADKPAADE